jgi:hypothetical protein
MIYRLKLFLPSKLLCVLSALSLLAFQLPNGYAMDKKQHAAESKESTSWQWAIAESSMLESKITISNAARVDSSNHNNYQVGCNLVDANKYGKEDKDEITDPPSRVEKFVNSELPNGILLISCPVGAHSRLLEVYDPSKQSSKPVFSRVGSYYAGWKVEQERLVLYFDQPCESDQYKTSKPSDCEQFYEVSIQWPRLNN